MMPRGRSAGKKVNADHQSVRRVYVFVFLFFLNETNPATIVSALRASWCVCVRVCVCETD